MQTHLNKGDIVRTKTDYSKNGKIVIPNDTPGQVVGVVPQVSTRGKHPFSYQIRWFVYDFGEPVTLSWKWISKCIDDCDSCRFRFLCITNKQNFTQ